MKAKPFREGEPLFPCSRCGTPTRCNDLIGSDGTDRDVCADCLHTETLRELDRSHDISTDHHFRGEGPTPHPRTLEDTGFAG